MENWIKDVNPEVIYLNKGINSDSDLPTLVPEKKYTENYRVDETTYLWDILCRSRLIKNEFEIEAMRYSSKITCEGHIETMRKIK